MDDLIGGIFVICVLITALLIIGAWQGSDYQKDQAIKAGVAQYVCDPKTGETKFEYIGGNK